MLRDYGLWVYPILFAHRVRRDRVRGDAVPAREHSLLFAAGALAAVDSSGTLSAPLVSLTLIVAAIAGNTTNYHIGKWIGPPAFTGKIRFLKVEYLKRTEAFFVKHGSMTIVLSRFVPIIRTCAPFVAGVARMPYARFQAYNVFGGVTWVLLLVWAGYFFGNIPIIKENFGVVTIGIIVLSLVPLAWVALKK